MKLSAANVTITVDTPKSKVETVWNVFVKQFHKSNGRQINPPGLNYSIIFR